MDPERGQDMENIAKWESLKMAVREAQDPVALANRFREITGEESAEYTDSKTAMKYLQQFAFGSAETELEESDLGRSIREVRDDLRIKVEEFESPHT